jgi:hypothetical protein
MIGHCTHFGRPGWCCPICTAEDARLLLKSGRPAMAAKLLEELPDLIRDQLGNVYALGHDRVVLAQRAREEPEPGYEHEGWR